MSENLENQQIFKIFFFLIIQIWKKRWTTDIQDILKTRLPFTGMYIRINYINIINQLY